VRPIQWRHFSKSLGSQSLPRPFHFLPYSVLFYLSFALSPSRPFPLLRSRTPKIQIRGLGERCKLPQRGLGVWSGAPDEIEFGAFQTKNLASGGNNFNDFPENQLTKSREVYTKGQSGTKILSLVFYAGLKYRLTMITEGRTELTSFHCHTLIY